jgi:hypothetical protein
MFLALFFVLLACWIFGWIVFHVAGGLIHLLLIVALISFAWHFVKGRAAVTDRAPRGFFVRAFRR